MKLYVFIDYQNLKMALQKNIKNCNGRTIYVGWKLDMKKLYIYLLQKYHVNRVYLFLGYIKEKESYYVQLKDIGYYLIFKKVVIYTNQKSIKYKGNVDVDLTLEVTRLIRVYDGAIIITGDGDYISLVEYLYKNNKLIRIIIPNKLRFSILYWDYKEYLDYLNGARGKQK